jgi:hypothetical protein
MPHSSSSRPAPATRSPCLAALAGLLALWAGPAGAQETFQGEARAALIEPLTLTKLADLDFGYIIPATGGTIILSPTVAPNCTTTGTLIQSGPCQPAAFAGLGAQGQRVRVRRPVGRTITLTGPGEAMDITNITINGNPGLTPVRSNPNWERYLIASADGSFTFRVGGTLTVNPEQAPGIYSGSFDIRIDYQ